MPEFTVELAVGDVIFIGNRSLTVIDIEGSEVHFRMDDDLSSPPPGPASQTPLAHEPDSRVFRQKAK